MCDPKKDLASCQAIGRSEKSVTSRHCPTRHHCSEFVRLHDVAEAPQPLTLTRPPMTRNWRRPALPRTCCAYLKPRPALFPRTTSDLRRPPWFLPFVAPCGPAPSRAVRLAPRAVPRMMRTRDSPGSNVGARRCSVCADDRVRGETRAEIAESRAGGQGAEIASVELTIAKMRHERTGSSSEHSAKLDQL